MARTSCPACHADWPGQRPAGRHAPRAHGQLCRPLQSHAGRFKATATPCASGGLLKKLHHRLVRAVRSPALAEVPCPPVDVNLFDENLRERAVRAAQLGVTGRLVDRRPHQRMMERKLPRLNRDQISPLRRVERRSWNTEPDAAANTVARRHVSSAAATSSSCCVCSGRRRTRRRKCADKIRRRQRPRQRFPTRKLAQRSNEGNSTSASGLPPVASIRRLSTSSGIATPTRVRRAAVHPLRHIKPLDTQVRQQPRMQREPTHLTVAGGKEQRYPVRVQPAGHKLKSSGRRIVQPLSVIDYAEHRRSPASWSSIPRTASDTRKRLSWLFAIRPNAIPSASARGAGSRSM